ncbi:hypothetical protein LXL04_022677 [Taraxacum kok-saghyz]
MGEETGQFHGPGIPKFDGDYDHWSMVMENLLRSKEYWRVVDEGYQVIKPGELATPTQQKNYDENKLKDLKACNYLFQSIDKSILKQIQQKETAKQIWDAMKLKFRGNERVKRAQLQRLGRDFKTLEIKTGETVTDYLGRVMVVSNDMWNPGENMSDVKIVEKVLRTITESFNFVVCTIKESKDIDTMIVDELQSSLLIHEQKIRRKVNDEQVLKVESDQIFGRGRGRGRGNSNRGERTWQRKERPGNGRSSQQLPVAVACRKTACVTPDERDGRGKDGWTAGKNDNKPTFDKSQIECYKCHQFGHFQYECQNDVKQVNYTEFKDSEELLLMAAVDIEGYERETKRLLMTMEEDTHNKKAFWFQDSTCSNHMTGIKEWFIHIDETYQHKVRLRNDHKLEVKGRGDIRIGVNDMIQVITNVYYVPSLTSNLMSVGQLQEKALTFVIQGNVCRVFHPQKGLIISSNMTKNRMFPVYVSTQQLECLQVSRDSSTQLWHKRFGHVNHKAIRTMLYKGMVIGLPATVEKHGICETCVTGKQHREVIPKKSNWHATEKLQLIHTDLCGPISPASISEKRYVLVFIDDFTRKSWVYFLSRKSESFELFKNFKRSVEVETGMKIKCLRSDRGGEFTSNEFNEYCETHGIERQLTAAYTPQQNGVAERRNRTLMNMVRCLLIEKNMPKYFWSEAARWAYHVLNRCMSRSLDDKVPEEMWTGSKPNVEHFKVFRCIGHVHVPAQLRTKLDARSHKDRIFDEDTACDWPTTNQETQELIVEDDEPVQENPQEEENAENSQNSPSPAQNPEVEEGSPVQDEAGFAMYSAMEDPLTYEEACKEDKWRQTMNAEITAIERNHTWELVDLPAGTNPIGVKWVFKTKINELGKVDKYKARLVVKGYAQKEGVDYNEVFAPVPRWDTIRTLIAMAAQRKWKVYQLDVKSAFLNGELKEVVHVTQPKGFIKKGEEEKVYRLRRALYGLKQAPRAWFNRIEGYFLREGFKKSSYDHTMFVKTEQDKIIFVSLYVDDLIYAGNDQALCESFKKSMQQEFEMTDLGQMKFFLGVEVNQNSEGITLCQSQYAKEVLKRFKMSEANGVKNPIVPDLMYVVSLLARFMAEPKEEHMAAAKRVLRYIKGTVNYGLHYKNDKDQKLQVFTDSNYARDSEDQKSSSGYVCLFSGAAICWSSRKQEIVTLSSTETEYVAATTCACHCVWLKGLLEELEERAGTVEVMCDNCSAIKLSKNPVMHRRTKHIDVRYHYIRELVNKYIIKLKFCGTKEQLADMMTKPLTLAAFKITREEIGVKNIKQEA